MRRILLGSLVASILGISPLPLLGSSEAWAQRARSSKSSKGKSKKPPVVKTAPKSEPKADPGPVTSDPITGEAASSASGSAPPPSRGPSRIDFDDRLIQGQTNKSGAVYLYDRKELKTRSMIKERDSFRSETLSTVYDQ